MEKGAVVGRLSGPLPTFLGLLYAAQMRISTAHGQQSYRFSCPAEALRAVGGLHQALCSGEIPSATDPEEVSRVSFLMDYPDRLAKRLLPFGRSKAERGLPELQLGTVPLVEGKGQGELVPAQEGWGALVGCKVLVAIAGVVAAAPPKGPEPCDPAVARIIAEAPSPKPEVVIVFQFADEPPPPAPAKEGEKPPPFVPPLAEAAARANLGASFASTLLPRTQAALAAARAEPAYFFSWVATDRGPGGALRAKRRRLFDAGGVEPVYPFEEFEGLVAHLGRVAG